MHKITALALAGIVHLIACHPTEAEVPQSSKGESEASRMPESLRCKQAADCTVQSVCYWAEPSCVAAATMVAPKCDDADPKDTSREAVTCGCNAGQCVVN